MKRHGILCLLIPIISFSFSGCASDQSKWTILNDTETIKPRKGIAQEVSTFEGYEGFEWVDQNRFIAFKQSDTTFGVDRGLTIVNALDRKLEPYIETQKKPNRVLLSPDSKSMVYSVSSEGKDAGRIVFNDLATDQEKSYAYDAWTFKAQKPWMKGLDLLLPDPDKHLNVWRMSADGRVKTMPLVMPKDVKIDNQLYVETCFESDSSIYAIIGGYTFNEMVVYDKATKTSTLYPQKKVIDAGKNPMNGFLYMIQQGKNYNDHTLSIVAEDQSVIPIAEHKEIVKVAWSPQGRFLIYAVYTAQNETEIHMVDLVNRSSHFMTAYGKDRVENIRMSPDEKKVLIQLGPNPVTKIMMIQ